ncbi:MULTISPECIES: rubredoxin-like domain-containing protein [Archaeoglobus]|uniref:Rubredoxin-like domain-containing protein n=3 Tax=Archaeoglobus fulgidus TaxID=2234 RepID=O29906_ARCFU|nr:MULTISPECIES: rubredoxin [Archaeoglobus]AAB90901.1 conserved hypothetical protein [Archaeoglobus fulgidus DSM 4304]AIG97162.1 Rubredoxin [Archaeoglobus fulgidus DSM 8774]KUJ94316.1 MAG: hypothetical protein XD40_0410 [Archaeoglobus fulgidus]KUK05277.1 MAG: hypothetical protein XD48_2488 [Archaeoglobus fulgidus]MDI3497201.1 hypothetical protein [Archaeoglobus sp.]
MKRWRCKLCGLVFRGDEPPEVCGRCGATKEQFEEIKSYRETRMAKSKK